MATYDPTTAGSLQRLTALALGDVTALPAAGLPDGWSLYQTFSAGGMQGFVAIGSLDGRTPQLVLVLGATWPSYLAATNLWPRGQAGPIPEVLLDASGTQPMASAGPTPTFDLASLNLYLAMRGEAWSVVQAAVKASFPDPAQVQLLVCGQGPGAPMAQLAAFDFRPGKKGSPLQFSVARCYVFSAPGLANATFQAAFATAVPDAWALQVVSRGTAVDTWPSAPTSADGFLPLGGAQALSLALPTLEDPWWERSGTFYAQAFPTRAPSPPLARRKPALDRDRLLAIGATPPGYDPGLAYTATLLAAAANRLGQHPTLPIAVPSPWTLVQTVGDGRWVSVFAHPAPAVAVVFRDTNTFAEGQLLLANVGPITPDWMTNGAGVHAGGLSAYTEVRAALRSLLQARGWEGTPLTLAGHSFGAVCALIAAADLAIAPVPGVPVPSTYCLGSPASVGWGFPQAFATSPIAASTWQVSRDRDTVAALSWNQLLTRFGAPVTLSGQTPYDDVTSHGLTSYETLLNPGLSA